jgi:uncharacterized RDD family membrane protein YckC
MAISRPEIHFGGFWIRLLAGMIDLAILGVPLAVFVSFLSVGTQTWRSFLKLAPSETQSQIHEQFGFTFLFWVLCFFVFVEWLYFASMESSKLRATLGKLVLGLEVGDANGNPIGFWKASRRFACGRLLMHVPQLGLYYFAVDCGCIGVTPGKRAIHDRISGCVVFRGSQDWAKIER